MKYSDSVARLFLAALSCFIMLSQYCHAEDNSFVAIDVGHYKMKPGVISARGIPEFEFNKALANVLVKRFMSKQVTTKLIGNDGLAISLSERTSIAKAIGSTFFLSIHHDSIQPQYLETWIWKGKTQLHSERFSGFSLFVSRKNAGVNTSLQCAREIGSALIQAGFKPSLHHAEQIPGENREWADKNSGVYYFDDLVVLKTATMPAVLLEAGIIINRDEELLMQSPHTQNLIATSVTEGLKACKVIK